MAGFTKLHGAIIHSSIWSEPHTVRILWITMLAMADKDGVVQASIGGLAHTARITRDECAEALEILAGPDPDSRDGTTGERIEKTGGGWLLLNHANYRDSQTREQRLASERVRKHRETHAERPPVLPADVTPVTLGNAPKRPAASASASASEKRKNVEQAATLADEELESLRQEWLAVRRERHGLKSLSARSWKTIENRAEKSGVPLKDVLEQLAEHGWQTWKPEYGKAKFGNGKPEKTGPGNNMPAGMSGSLSDAVARAAENAKKREQGRESA